MTCIKNPEKYVCVIMFDTGCCISFFRVYLSIHFKFSVGAEWKTDSNNNNYI